MKKSYTSWIVLGVIGFVAFCLGKKLLSGGGLFAGAAENQKAQENAESTLDRHPVDTKLVTKTPQQLQQVAESQKQAFNDLGTDEELLFSSLKGLNTEELKVVAKKFGVYAHTVFGITVWKGNLFDWYNAELSGSDLLKMRGIWAPTLMWS